MDEGPAAGYRDVLSNREYRGVYAGAALSWTGDYMARAAVTALVFAQTRSPFLAAIAFAVSFVPVALLGPVLAAFAERHPNRRVMLASDVGRMLLMGVVALPGMPVPALMVLLFLTAMLGPPFDSSRSALLARILEGDRLPVGLSLNMVTFQIVQVGGYALGGILGSVNANAAIVINAATFGASALCIALTVKAREPIATQRKHLLRESAEGLRMVFGTPVLRAIALAVFAVVGFTIIPEGAAAAWAAHLGGDTRVQGLIMAANPLGAALGAVLLVRMLSPGVRFRIIKQLSWVPSVVLLPVFLDPPWWAAVAISFVGGFASAGVLAPANALFVRALPDGYRARAFSVMQSGIMVAYVVVIFLTGWLIERFGVPMALGALGVAGFVLTVLASRPSWRAQ